MLFLAVSTFIPQTSEFPPGAYPGTTNVLIHFFHLDRFYSSPVNVVLWGLLTGIIIGSILLKGIRTPIQKVIHLLLALCFIVIAIEKGSNQRFDFRIKEGEEIRFSDYTDSKSDKYDISIKLLDFDIQYHPGQHTAKAFISRLQIDGKDTVYLAVNKPYAIGHYRLYQSVYDQEIIFYLTINGEDYPVIFGDTVFVDSSEFILEGFNHQQRVFNLKINGKYYHTGMQQPRRIDNYSIVIAPGGTRYTSIIVVAKVRWTKLLLILGFLYIAGLFIAFWRRR